MKVASVCSLRCSLALISLSWIFATGCRAVPTNLAVMVLGDVVSSVDVQLKSEEMLGKDISEAERIIGPRLETWHDLNRQQACTVLYPVKGDVLKLYRYEVACEGGQIVSIARTMKRIDGVEDVVREGVLRSALIGKSEKECREACSLWPPVSQFHAEPSGARVLLFDVRNFTNLRNERRCLVWFDKNKRCTAVQFVGVSASAGIASQDRTRQVVKVASQAR